MRNKKPQNVEDYLNNVPEPARSTLRNVQAIIRSVVPAETREVISYGIPTFKYIRALVAYGAFSDHCSFFPMNSSLIDTFKDELKDFDTSKGTIRFPLDKPLPAPLLRKMTRARVAQNKERARLK